MELSRLAEYVGATVVVAAGKERALIGAVFASDRMSDLLGAVTDSTLLVTNLTNSGLARLIELMEAPAVCLLNGVLPDEKLLTAAHAHGTALLVSADAMYETCGRLFLALNSAEAVRAR